MKIWTDDEYIEVNPNDVDQLEAAMRFKAEHIKAKAAPELFSAVAYMLFRLWDSATKRVDVVRCRECKYYGNINAYTGTRFDFKFCNKFGNVTRENDFCSYGERKEGAD